MKNKNRRLIWILLILFVGLFAVGAACTRQSPSSDPSLLQPTFNVKVNFPMVQSKDEPEGEPTDVFQNGEDDQSSKPVCGGPESMSVLVLGIDEQAQSDAIRLVRLDFVEKNVSSVSIPRDFYVPIVDRAENNITQGRINATYGYGEWFDGPGQGIISLADNLEYNFGVTFDHYLVLNFQYIGDYIDQIGGIEILLDKPVADGNLYFSSGLHHMDGETAVGFMRMRYYDTDFARIRRQSMVLRAFFKKAVSELNLFEQLQLTRTVLEDKNIQSDVALTDVYPVLCLANALDSDGVEFIEIPSEMYHSATTTSGGAVQIPHDNVAPFLQSVMNGSYQP